MSTPKAILVTGATGKQGGAVVQYLLESGSKDIVVLALTRNAQSGSAKKLEEKGVKVVQGDLDNVSAVFVEAKKVLGSNHIWGIYSVQAGRGSHKVEEAQAKGLVDAALVNGVEFFVYGSGDRGGDEMSYDNPTPIVHWQLKHRMEHYLVDNAKGKMQWVILRPTAFMENLEPGIMGKTMATWWKNNMKKDETLQFVSTKDIGWFGAQAFLHPEQYAGRGISLAGDKITFDQFNELFKKVTGKDYPRTFDILGKGMLFLMSDFDRMFKWLNEKEGSDVDIDKLRKTRPELLNFEAWIRTASKWEVK